MEDLSIRNIIESVTRGQIRIPAFQRGYVWDPERVAYLMDSIYKGYPFGSLMFWRTKEQLKYDRNLGPFRLPAPKDDYPVDYVLDGQQRVTSIFSVFQTDMKPEILTDWLDIYFDLSAEQTAQDSQFIALLPEQVDRSKLFPLKTLFDTTAYRAATEDLPEGTIKKIDEMQAVFKETKIPVQITRTDDKATVAIIFERVNRQGVELDTLQLLSAWTWSEEFQLADQFEELASELQPFGFADVGGDTDLLLRCCSAVLAKDASPKALMSLNGAKVRENFDTVTNGVKHAVDYLRQNYKIQTLNNLPYVTMLVPLSVFFAVSGNKEMSATDVQRTIIDKWFWRSAFLRRYSSGVLRNLKADIEEMSALRDGRASKLGAFDVQVDSSFFLENNFSMGNVNTKTFLLLLATQSPVSFISGVSIDLAKTLKAANRTEFHHMMPKEFLIKTGQKEFGESVLANICFLSRSDNRKLGGNKPSEYKKKMPQDKEKISEILERAAADECIFEDNYEKFARRRAEKLAEIGRQLCQLVV